jgi:uncharacterized membrane protein YraQ (UPF0718 family)
LHPRVGVVAEADREAARSTRKLIAAGFGTSFWAFFALAVVSGVACYFILGEQAFATAVRGEFGMVVLTMPRILVALGVAGLIWVMLPRERLVGLVGQESGLRGLLIAEAAGMVTPGGPVSAFSLLAVLGGGGADRGAMVAYITAWSMLGLQRILVWDVPFMGPEFSATRFTVCLLLPIIAGLIARRLPLELRIAGVEPVGKARS